MKIRIFVTALMLLPLSICGVKAQEKKGSIDNEELRELFEKDQAERKVSNPNWQELIKKDSLRRQQVLTLIESNKLQTSGDYYHAAMIFQHGTDTLASGMAVKLMKRAVSLDSTMNKWLLAAAIDRDLMRKGEPQIYGTQYVKNGVDKPFELYKIDTTKITDAERREYNVRTLEEQREQVILMNKKNLMQLVAEGKTAADIIEFVKGNPDSPEYNLSEASINSLGYYYMSQQKYQDALDIFELNIGLYPEAYNTYDSFGEALLQIGRKKEAIKAYKKSLELNPENQNAVEILKEIKKRSSKT